MTNSKPPSKPGGMTCNLLPHPLAEAIPPMLTDEYIELVVDIRVNGLRQPIVLFEGMMLDGRHRARACAEIGTDPGNTTFSGTAEEAKAHVNSLNVHRRHLSLAQKRKIVAVELKPDPTQSDRSIAAKARTDHKTVASARAIREATGEIPQSDVRIGKNGVAKPAVRQARVPRSGKDRVPTPAMRQQRTPPQSDLPSIRIARETVAILAGLCQGIASIERQGLPMETEEANALLQAMHDAMTSLRWLEHHLDGIANAGRTSKLDESEAVGTSGSAA